MYLKKVEISGFKSFANKTRLEFLPACSFNNGDKKSCGITAIVGPNGAGKSNVADAIRWAMGEQSMKNLRGKKSEDVIFAGSGKKARLGSAWATLHFDNSDKRIPLEFREVTITRKLFRSGDSEYLINESRVRLIDVIDLLAKAGIGRESYCVINQGMSDAVLSASAAERRMILEDAAGVKQYQIKKERAIRKMESTKNNLLRVADLVKEIEPHLRMLKRQSEKARKGKEISQNLQDKQRNLFSYLWNSFQTEKESASSEKNELGAKMMNAQREADKFSDELEKESKKFQDSKAQDELEKKKKDLHQNLNEKEKELVITEGRIEIEKERQSQQKTIESIPVDLGFVKAKLERIRQNQEKLIFLLDKAESPRDLQDIKGFAKTIQQELFDLQKNVGEGKVEISRDLTESDKKEKEKLDNLTRKSEEVREEIKNIKARIESVEKEIEKEAEKSRETRQRFFELERELRRKQDELGKLKDRFNEAKVKLAKVEVREEDLSREIESELKINPGELKYDGSKIDEDDLKKEISKLKVQLEQIGGIDPLVVDEYEETKNRFDFLNKESQDLEKAIKSLKEVIKEMDQRISETFNQAFEQINKEFTKYFRIIFGGGNAKLVKTLKQKNIRTKNPDEVEDSKENGEGIEEYENEEEEEEKEEVGIDISACPPGKKITNLSMLSGGERSLTSIALLFAIISHNPPPFAVLDEVEAALDEANSRRFGRILHELSGNTQFVIITHNRETMRQASLLYGVTMGEDGISKLLSVRLDQVEQGGRIVEKN
ncbi:MAG: hypothetical protein A3J63_02950 [Candidatus Moranbacteria bacterium RIFCSPHIGHO2_02_FULL_40_12b]|nr:MAG: hypothetical protein A3J63_02950 [Candidatus Moranbacteria bacterium RIFCSPHIGHO2_02_FULL_40_12b]OGI24318.1 MAG: hypothetical protein A3E91_00145 [Candidatus Moranbacteria bacterium RIFCSPHIGHO2_12_FULL_40_10]